ncbi:COBRA-like protein 1 [Selaginella moellendorffii]|uniref:COBRA-like protein 1 n=1 Tax=Selaginella moellendorffii TaxID=88036 RepID=UPI000D1CBF4C|nr:COBRA-like protein 1 [Selaginella moellendorffii]|eukprot:XP_024520797.1 COBRA-like protein 1 [Selaginella moellendorffii]
MAALLPDLAMWTRMELHIAILALALLLWMPHPAESFDPLDPNGNITIKWDVMSWSADGYVALVTMYNYQQYRHIETPGWTLGWTWAKKEVIWGMQGAQATMQGDCSKFKGNIPHCCKRDPTVVDLLPGVPYSMQVANCCRGGVLGSLAQDPTMSVASFQVIVGQAGTSNTTVQLPKNFTIRTPGPGYTCGPAKKVKASLFPSADGRRHTQALMTWNITCSYSQYLAQRAPTCCVSFSSFYNEKIVPCQNCACNCKPNVTQSAQPRVPMCFDPDDSYLPPVVSTGIGATSSSSITKNQPLHPQLFCSSDMCPIKIHWHVKINYKDYWRAKVTITNRHVKNYTQWNLVVQHPNFNNLTEAFSFTYRPLQAYGSINDTAMFWGIKFYNDMLMQAGEMGNVQSEVLLQKGDAFTFSKGWAFPHRVLFNGDECVLPDPDLYPWLPSASSQLRSGLVLITTLLAFSTAKILALF